MLSPKKLIPPLAVAALPLVGTACGDSSGGGGSGGGGAGGVGGAPANDLEAQFRDLCGLIVECFPQDYADQQECITALQPYIDNIIDNYTGACVDAYAALFMCWNGLTCEEYAGAGYYACRDQFDPAITSACGFPPAE